MSNFPDYAGPLTETILVGNIALWIGGEKRIGWDAANMIASDVPTEHEEAVNRMIRHEYLNGYSISELTGASR